MKCIVLEGVRLGLYTVVLLAAIPKPVGIYHKGQPSNLY